MKYTTSKFVYLALIGATTLSKKIKRSETITTDTDIKTVILTSFTSVVVDVIVFKWFGEVNSNKMQQIIIKQDFEIKCRVVVSSVVTLD